MCLNFNVNQAMALALVREEAAPLVEALRALTPIPADAQWGNFVRNHDEWSLDKLSEAERQEVFAAFGPEADMQLFGRGLRRRLPSMLGGDQARLRMVYSLMFSLPGAPVLFYGEEIGMAENLEIEGRMSVRSPMQWSGEANAGFSTAAQEKLRRPVVAGDDYGPSAVNVADQRRDPDSLLNWMERLIRTRKECPEIGWGTSSCLTPALQASSHSASTGATGLPSSCTILRASGSRPGSASIAARTGNTCTTSWATETPSCCRTRGLSSTSARMAIAGFASIAKVSGSCRSSDLWLR